jgi:hypothetical protein
MKRLIFVVALAIGMLLSLPRPRAQQNPIIYNPNSYPVWVAISNWITGGDFGVPDVASSRGWIKIPAGDSTDKGEGQYLYVRAYNMDTKAWFQIRPVGAQKFSTFLYKFQDFQENFEIYNHDQSWEARIKARGGEPKPYYPLQAYKNPNTGRYEVPRIPIDGGEILPPPVGIAAFTNRTDARVFFRLNRAGGSEGSSLAPGQNIWYKIQFTDPTPSVSITQNDGSPVTLTLPKPADYEFHAAGGKIMATINAQTAGFRYIHHQASGKLVCSERDNGSLVHLWGPMPPADAPAYQFQLVASNEPGYYYLYHRQSGKFVCSEQGDATRVHLWGPIPDGQADRYKFRLVNLNDGLVYITHKWSGKYVCSGKNNGEPLWLWGTPPQGEEPRFQFRLTNAD